MSLRMSFMQHQQHYVGYTGLIELCDIVRKFTTTQNNRQLKMSWKQNVSIYLFDNLKYLAPKYI